MATIPTVTNFDLTKIPVEGTQEFRANASYVWSTIPSVITSMNNSIAGMNKTATEVNNLRNGTANDANLAQQASLNAQASANFKGVWSSSKGYTLGESVLGSDNVFYVCLRTHTTAQNPRTTGVYWRANVPMGAIGNINSQLLDLPLQNSLAMKAGVGSVNFDRDTDATYIDRYGVLQESGAGEPRFEKDGLLIEGASTNIALYSEDIANHWTLSRITAENNTNDVTDPYGTNLATKIISTTENGAHYTRKYPIPANTDTDYAYSIFVKKGSKKLANLQIVSRDSSNTESSIVSSIYDLETEEIVNGTFTSTNKLANGWFRLTVSAKTLSDTDSVDIRLSMYDATSDSTDDYMYAFGGQLEKLPFASSYIPTTDSAVTRGFDVLSVQGDGNNPSTYNNRTYYMEASTQDRLSNSNNQLFFISNSLVLSFQNTEAIYGTKLLLLNGDSTNVLSGNISNTEVMRSFTCTYDNGIAYLYMNGMLVNSAPISITDEFGQNDIKLGNNLNGHIKNFRILNKALTSKEVALLG